MRTAGDLLLLEQQRLHAIGVHEQGLAPAVIAKGLRVHPQSVRHGPQHYRAGGLDALRAKLHPGPRPKLSDAQKRELPTLLGQPPSAYGLRGELWTTAAMATLMRQRWGVGYHPSHVGQMMRDLGYSQQFPSKNLHDKDSQNIVQWRDEHWPRIVERAQRTGATVVFVDEAMFLMSPLRKRVWAPVGQTPRVLSRARHPMKVSVIGGLWAGLDPSGVGPLTRWHPGENVDAPRVVSFLEHLLERIEGQIVVAWDNLAAHRSKLLKAWLKGRSRLWLEALPPYAPDLNPIELVCCMSKYHRLANHTLADIERLQEAAQHAVDEIPLKNPCSKAASATPTSVSLHTKIGYPTGFQTEPRAFSLHV